MRRANALNSRCPSPSTPLGAFTRAGVPRVPAPSSQPCCCVEVSSLQCGTFDVCNSFRGARCNGIVGTPVDHVETQSMRSHARAARHCLGSNDLPHSNERIANDYPCVKKVVERHDGTANAPTEYRAGAAARPSWAVCYSRFRDYCMPTLVLLCLSTLNAPYHF